MDINSLIQQYFLTSKHNPSIDVFDAETIYAIYQKVVGVLTHHLEIEMTMLQAMSYCFYEVLDNVLTHSGSHMLRFMDGRFVVEPAEFWQGTLVFLELSTDKEIDPNAVVANRTDCASQYNEEFLDKSNIDNLW